MELIYTSGDNTLTVKLVYIVKSQIKYYRGVGKAWPKHTQCLVFVDGLFHGFGEVVKHDQDIDNQAFALKLATKKAIVNVDDYYARKALWSKLFNEIKKKGI